MTEQPDVEHYLGLDLGQASDPSALTVTEKHPTEDRPQYACTWIERFDLGTPYTEIVRRVAAVQDAPETGHDPPLVMDATGVGAPVVDQFQEEGLDPVQIVFTSGDSVARNGKKFKVPKQDLATTVQTLLQNGRLSIAEALEEAAVLVREMKRFRVKWTDAGHARFEHAQETDTDDVLLSLACALWYAERTRGPGGGGLVSFRGEGSTPTTAGHGMNLKGTHPGVHFRK